ncbi:MAG: dockerin type I repeat-containing protein, partial [Clostridia bacterium]|nr:dockerin type I repeat-containing protein [Clostridia bacterium]
MKKTLAIIISLILVVSCAAVHTSASEPILGDVNESGEVNSDDAIYLLRYVLFGDMYPVQGVTDFDGNGVLNSDDAIYLLRHVLFGDMYPLTHPAAVLASDRLANASKYLFRVGNANAVKLGTLFRAINDTPDPSKVNVTIEAVAPSD